MSSSGKAVKHSEGQSTFILETEFSGDAFTGVVEAAASETGKDVLGLLGERDSDMVGVSREKTDFSEKDTTEVREREKEEGSGQWR